MTEVLNELREKAIAIINEYNGALANGNARLMNEKDIDLKEVEKEYATEMAKVVFQECLATENPILTAVMRYQFNVIGHKDNKEDGIITGRELVDDRSRQIDLLKLGKYSQKIKADNALNTDWEHTCEKFNQLLCMRTARELKFTAPQIKALAKTYYMGEIARKLELGETPDSNTQIVKLLQSIVDQILFLDDGKGKNTYKVNNHDASYLIMLYTRKGKATLSVQTAKHDFLRRIISDVLYRIVTNGQYSVEYKQIKPKA